MFKKPVKSEDETKANLMKGEEKAKKFPLRRDYMNYKERILESLEKASEKQLERLYHFIKSYLG